MQNILSYIFYIREGGNVMGSRTDLFENKGVFSAIMNLALPSVMGQIILVIYNMADTLFVGMSGSDAMITAVTVCMPAFMFLSAISNLFGVGASSVISRALGKNEGQNASLAAAFALWGTIGVTAVYCLGAFLFADKFIDILGGKMPGIHENALSYLYAAVILGGIPTAVSTTLSHIIRSRGYSLHASAGIAIGGVLNIALDPLFMFVILPRGNEALGAAVATALSNLCALIYYIIVLIAKKKRFRMNFAPSREMFGHAIPKDVFSVGIAACLMTLCENISYAVLDNLMCASGTAAQAGVGVAKKINMLAHCFVRGMSQGVLPLIGYNYASGNRRRMMQVIRMTLMISVVISLLCTTCSLTLAKPLVSLFIRTKGESLTYGAKFLRILSIGAPFSALAYTVISFFQATGRGKKSLILALLRKGIADIPLMFLLSALIPTYGIVAATPLTDVLCSIVAAILLMRFLKQHGTNKGAYAEA